MQRLGDFINNSSQISILRHVRIREGVATGSNMEAWADVPVPWAASLPPMCVPYAQLSAFLDRTADKADETKAKIDEGRLVLQRGRSRVALPYLDEGDFPLTEHVAADVTTRIAKSDLAIAIHAVSVEQARYYLCGVALTEDLLYSTDGKRAVKLPVEHGYQDIILPSDFAKFVIKHGGDTIELATDGARATWHGPNGLIATTKLIDGRYPDIGRLFATLPEKSCRFDKDELRSALALVSLAGTQVNFEPADGACRIYVQGNDGEACETAIEISGDPITAAFNVKHVRDTLDAHDGEGSVDIRWDDAQSPTLWFGHELIVPSAV